MNTTNLATFVAVMQTGSISSAAEKLYITQPAVSKRIKNLEDEFGTALFDTVGRSIIPTAAAYDLLPFVRRWLDDYEACKASLQHAKEVASAILLDCIILRTYSNDSFRLIQRFSLKFGLWILKKLIRQYLKVKFLWLF